MPQMAPYNWFILFIMFNMMLVFFVSNNHFYPYYFIKKEKSYKYIIIKNYKWKW